MNNSTRDLRTEPVIGAWCQCQHFLSISSCSLYPLLPSAASLLSSVTADLCGALLASFERGRGRVSIMLRGERGFKPPSHGQGTLMLKTLISLVFTHLTNEAKEKPVTTGSLHSLVLFPVVLVPCSCSTSPSSAPRGHVGLDWSPGPHTCETTCLSPLTVTGVGHLTPPQRPTQVGKKEGSGHSGVRLCYNMWSGESCNSRLWWIKRCILEILKQLCGERSYPRIIQWRKIMVLDNTLISLGGEYERWDKRAWGK